MAKDIIFIITLSVLVFANTQITSAQQSSVIVAGSVSMTNNGISIVPALSLDKPAAVFNLSVGNWFRFEPELRFSMEGEPCSFLFWFRYDLIRGKRFSLRVVSCQKMWNITLAGTMMPKYSKSNNYVTEVELKIG